MNTIRVTLALAFVSGLASFQLNAQNQDIPNRLIDYPGFMAVTQEVSELRKERRLSEEEFIHLSQQEDTIILDSRSLAKYQAMHIAGAVHFELLGHYGRDLEAGHPLSADPSSHLLQQQLCQRTRVVPDQESTSIPEHSHLHHALRLRVPEHLRAGTDPGPRHLEAQLQPWQVSIPRQSRGL